MFINIFKNLTRYKFRIVIIALNLSLSLLIIIILGSVFIIKSVNEFKNETLNSINTIDSKLNIQISDQFNIIERIVDTITYNTTVQNALFYFNENNVDSKNALSLYVDSVSSYNYAIKEVNLISTYKRNLNYSLYNDSYFSTGKFRLNESDRNYIMDLIIDVYNTKQFQSGKLLYFNTPYQSEINQYYIGISLINSALSKDESYFEPLGVAVVILDKKYLSNVIANNTLVNETSVYISDNSGKSIIEYNPLNQDIYSFINGNLTEKSWISYESKKYFTKSQQIENTNWKIIVISSDNNLIKKINDYISLFIYVFIIIIIFTIFTTIISNMMITRPLKEIADVCDKVAKGDMKIKLNFKRKNEFTAIADNFNNMLDEINTLTRKIFNTQQTLYENEVIKQEILLENLITQINSHFLYNTLNTIRGMSKAYETEKIDEIIKNLVSYFRFNVSRELYIKIHDEIKLINCYSNIMQLRNKNYSFKIIIDINDDLMNNRILKMSLQPIIENAILHGFTNEKMPRILKIQAKADDDYIYIKVIDNGKGILKDELVNLQHELKNPDIIGVKFNQYIGILNIQQRLKIQYGNDCGITLTSYEGRGTIVKVKYNIKVGN